MDTEFDAVQERGGTLGLKVVPCSARSSNSQKGCPGTLLRIFCQFP